MQVHSANTEIAIASRPAFVIPKSRKTFFLAAVAGMAPSARGDPDLAALITNTLAAFHPCISITTVP
jgi:hypothetical protein